MAALLARLVTGTLAACLLGGSLRAELLVVGSPGDPSADYSDLQLAVTEAHSGDTLLLRGGGYGAPTIRSKTLTLVADDAANVDLFGTFRVDALRADQQVVLRKLVLHATLDDEALRLSDNRGVVFAEECAFVGSSQPTNSNGAAIGVYRGSQLVVVGGALLGGQVDTPAPASGAGLLIQNGRVWAHDLLIAGGDGVFPSLASFGGAGGHAVVLGQGGFVADQCTLRGGVGGAGVAPVGTPDGCVTSGAGGDALRLIDAEAVASLRSTSLVPGLPSFAIEPCAAGEAGNAISNPVGGSVTLWDAALRSWTAGGPLQELGSLQLEFKGQAGDRVFLVLGSALHPDDVGPKGVLMPTLPLSLLGIGTLTSSASFPVDLQVPQLPPGLEALTLIAQLASAPAAGGLILSAPRALVLLGST